MRPEDRVRVLHMIEAAESAAQFLVGRSRDDLDRDEMLLFAVVHAIEIIGEAASRVSPEARAGTPEVPWNAIRLMRNRLIRGYADIDPEVVWATATAEVPAVLPLLRALVGTDAPEAWAAAITDNERVGKALGRGTIRPNVYL